MLLIFFKTKLLRVMLPVFCLLQMSGSYAQNAPQYEVLEGGLLEALNTVLKYNPAVKGQLAQLNVQGYAIDAAKAGRYPTMSLSANTLDEDYNAATLTVDQPIWTFGKLTSAIDGAQGYYELEKQGLLQIKRELLEKTAIAYAQVQSARQNIEVAQQNLIEHQELHQRIVRRNEVQLASVTDVHLANSRLLQAESDLLSYQGELQTAINELFALTMIPVATEQPIDTALMTLPDEQTVTQLAFEQSLDLAYATEQVNVAKNSLSQNKAAVYPTISLRVQQSVWETDPDYDTDRTQYGLVVSGEFAGMGATSFNQIKGAAEQINAVQYQLDSLRNEVRREVNYLLVNRKWVNGVRDSQTKTQKALTVTMESYFRQYESNRKSWVEALNSQRELTQMRYSLIASEYQWTLVSLQLATLIGKLDSFAGVNQP